jgi:hypothetical protein
MADGTVTVTRDWHSWMLYMDNLVASNGKLTQVHKTERHRSQTTTMSQNPVCVPFMYPFSIFLFFFGRYTLKYSLMLHIIHLLRSESASAGGSHNFPNFLVIDIKYYVLWAVFWRYYAFRSAYIIVFFESG